MVLFTSATAVIAADLELEGNILNDGNTDWEDIFDVSGNNVPTQANSLPAGYVESVFVRDFVPGASGPDISTFTTGSKDTLNITPGWECTRSNNVNDKTDIVNAYAVAATNGDIIVYFAMERYSNEGTGNIGFWFLKDGSTGCAVQPNGPKTLPFTGNHSDGDILIVAEFDNGGANVTILAYRWVGGAGGFLDPTPVAADSKCVNGGAAQNLCGIVNGNLLAGYGAGTDVPWLTETKQPGNTPSNDLDVSEFFEGKINLTALNLVGCFTKYMAVTRSSTSLTATIFDYALGDFSLCSIDVTKACTTGIDNPVINNTGDKVVTTFDVTVTNDGAGSVSNVTIEEDITLSAGESCELIAIDGDTTGLPTDISNGLPVEIAASLAKDASVVAQVRCTTNDNPLDNKVTARAKSVASAGSADLVESYDMTEQQLCPLAVNPMIDVNKSCTDVRLTTVGGVLTMEVEVDVTLTNTSEEKLINVLIANVVGDTAGGTPIPLQHVDSDGETVLPAFDGDLAPGETVYFESVYVPTVVKDGGTDPATASFEDRVDASGVGAISGQTATDFSTADCPLCPPHEE
ncbi:MAG: hypothetical protein HUJ23_10170 [Methylophaga sp.]|nr:hypothetical protein [Methylophaga sp.]